MKQKRCKICNFEWTPRVEKPLQCPKCKRYDWDKVIEETKK